MLASFSTPGSPTHVSVHGYQLTLTPGAILGAGKAIRGDSLR